MSWAMDQKLSGLEKLVLLVLANRLNGTSGRCDPSVERIASDAGISKRSVQRQIKALADAGLIEVRKRLEGPSQLSSFYTLKMHGLSGGVSISHPGSDTQSPGVVTDSHPKQEVKPGIEPKAAASKFVLPEWINQDSWEGFEQMRRAQGKHKQLTDYGRKLIVKELAKLQSQGHNPDEVLNQSTMKSWSGVFPISNGAKQAAPTPGPPVDALEEIRERKRKAMEEIAREHAAVG